MTVQWYPGHMAKAKRMVKEHLKLVDLVVELRDARVPISSANPDIDKIIGHKPRVIVLNKADLADPNATASWQQWFTKRGISTITYNARRRAGRNKMINFLAAEGNRYVRVSRVTGRPLRAPRCLVVGIPNVGKSSFINSLVGKTSAPIGAKPGVTRGKQLIRIGTKLQLLDTPGILWPKFDDPVVGLKLAAVGAVSEAGFHLTDVAQFVFSFLTKKGLISGTGFNDYLLEFASQRGYLLKGGELDLDRAMRTLWQEFAQGKYGRLTLDELPEV